MTEADDDAETVIIQVSTVYLKYLNPEGTFIEVSPVNE